MCGAGSALQFAKASLGIAFQRELFAVTFSKTVGEIKLPGYVLTAGICPFAPLDYRHLDLLI